MTCLILSPSQNCCHSHCVNKSRARVKCEKREINYAPCGTIPPRKQQSQGPTKQLDVTLQSEGAAATWTLHPWLGMPGSPVHLALVKQEPGGCWTGHSCSTTDPTGTQKLCGDKLVSNSSLDRRLRGLPLNCYMLLKKTTK